LQEGADEDWGTESILAARESLTESLDWRAEKSSTELGAVPVGDMPDVQRWRVQEDKRMSIVLDDSLLEAVVGQAIRRPT
jgi:hypothetical protein